MEVAVKFGLVHEITVVISIKHLTQYDPSLIHHEPLL